jgi:hypothetical protein
MVADADAPVRSGKPKWFPSAATLSVLFYLIILDLTLGLSAADVPSSS